MRYHCEYHEHVKALHLTVDLESAPDDLTALDIYDRKTIRLRHAFQSYSIPLPASIDAKKPLEYTIKDGTITCRRQADPIRKATGINDVPFSSPAELERNLLCAKCGSCLISGKGLRWRLLPSENWAEMMDSWHCHRGVTDEHHNEHHDQYELPDHIVSAAERIRARPGIGLIGLSYLLIHSTDGSDLKVVKDEEVCCRDCGHRVGRTEGQELRLQKAAVTDNESGPVEPLTYLVAEMLMLVSTQSVYKFLVIGGDDAAEKGAEPDADDGLLLWVLMPEARVTGTSVPVGSPGRRVCKVLYRPAGAADARADEVETVRVGVEVAAHLRDRLEANHITAGRPFIDGWRSSHLERYEAGRGGTT